MVCDIWFKLISCNCVCRSVIPCILIDVQGMSITTDFLRWKYQKVEYIWATWTQFIDSWFSYGWWWYLKIDAKIMFNQLPTSDWYFIYWVIWRNSNNRFLALNYNSWNIFQWATWTEYFTNFTWTTWTIYDTSLLYTWWNMTIKVNNNTVSTSSTWNMYQGHSLPIFCRYDNGKNSYDLYSKIRLYSFKIYSSSNTMVRNFVPCYRKSDNVIWLLDIVNKVFYTNQWSWSFTKWPDVN